ncbi:MAG: hypothetical protein FJ027_22180, partial [Candidatus Rokubacteria bacterium]|nr:hypothetical protein [Candidatus Rokubacteria bacterium]
MIEPPWQAMLFALGATLGAWALGRALLRAFGAAPDGLRLITALALGFGTLAHAWLALGLVGGYRPAVAWTLWAAGVLGAVATLGAPATLARSGVAHG